MALQSGLISASAKAQAPVPAGLILGLMIVFLIVCLIVTTTRIYTRFVIHRKLWWDDWTSIVTFIGTVAEISTVLLLMQHGGGVNYEDVPKTELKAFGKAWEALEMSARVGILFARLSVLLLYLRSFYPRGVTRGGPWWAIHAVIWINVLYSIALILVVCLQCVPYGLPFGDTCINEWLLLVLSSIINIISDFAILVIPLALIFKLQMSQNKRWAMWALFAFGSLAPLASVARLAYQIPTAESENKTVVYIVVSILAVAEQVVAVIVGCAPVVASLVIKVVRGRTKVSSTPSSRSGRRYGPLSLRKRFEKAPDPFRVTDFTRLEAASQDRFGYKTAASQHESQVVSDMQDQESLSLENYKGGTGLGQSQPEVGS
ncbi:hypothetical protein M406DRAFT_107002 [Cryphonectria parasitica EP155]|uniref:Rhodopsin domain-containing protein n=1 Tax=Cryphonectria parasitica (strain ATCC 38755 / EP155) TaxID=660469 RepID=A0A9P4Y1Y1_CRYP1|nr:uncharacterized protein M406DRAFT_107002 [Cryphonectria parasitica EP155]KAF3765041.1 hypothetical protein M406DRAFT_107002 [Cryphonectria parasitica EP155]